MMSEELNPPKCHRQEKARLDDWLVKPVVIYCSGCYQGITRANRAEAIECWNDENPPDLRHMTDEVNIDE
jgi:hypothetical protein